MIIRPKHVCIEDVPQVQCDFCGSQESLEAFDGIPSGWKTLYDEEEGEDRHACRRCVNRAYLKVLKLLKEKP